MNCDINLAKQLPCCAQSYKLGSLVSPKSNVYLIIENIGTGNRITKSVSSDAYGNIWFDHEGSFPVNQSFKIYIHENAGKEVKLPFIPNDSDAPVDFVTVSFYRADPFEVQMAYLMMEE